MNRKNISLPSTHRANILPIAVMAFAIVAFLLLVDLSISPLTKKKKMVVVRNMNTEQTTNTPIAVNTNASTDPTAGWKTYTNSTIGYSLRYPATCTYIQKTDQGDTVQQWTCSDKTFDFDVRYRTNANDITNNQWFETDPAGLDQIITLGGKTGNLFVNYHCGMMGCESEDIGYIVKTSTGLMGLEFTHHQSLYDESQPYALGADEKTILSSFTFTK
jgi:hypothetical protein